MYHFYSSRPLEAVRITAHRQTWFASTDIGISPSQKEQAERNIRSTDNSETARWSDRFPEQRLNISMHDFISSETHRNQVISEQVDLGALDASAESASKLRSPRKIINKLLSLSGIPIEISLNQRYGLVASKNGSSPYSIAELSDGERNALFIAASILIAETGSLILIDEPERHLHRSIISSFLTLLLAERPDCAFIISTHDTALPVDNPNSHSVLLRGCNYVSKQVVSWDAQLASSLESLDDKIKRDVLGARNKILFVEGEQRSLDKPLYSILFPSVSIVPKANCREVEQAVFGIREAEDLHWVRAFGIVDNDRRSADEIEQLKNRGVYILPIFSVESIYYHPYIQERVARLHAALTGEKAETLVLQAKSQALAEITRNKKHFCERVTDKVVRREAFSKMPSRREIGDIDSLELSIDVKQVVEQEEERLQALIDTQNLIKIVEDYPIRESGALGAIARLLGFHTTSQYQGAVLTLLKSDAEALAFVKGFFEPLENEVNTISDR